MKKPTVIIGKKQIIMTCLTLMLAIAVYINYASAPKITKDGEIIETAEMGDTVNYGDTEFVDNIDDTAEPVNAAAETADYFAQARLDKMNNRDEAVQTLQTIIGGGDLTEDELVINALDAVEVSKLIESEGTIESLVKAQGFEDCVAYLDGETAKVVIKTEGLDKAQAASVKEIIMSESEVSAENIRIFEVK
ncbi:MAG: SpoIIIAH-like family protein [Ruminococcus flavefaciens]|nr:SpoIIIAH-like family protein [Ruminococcus flavefaciens]MCM1229726.1 SpoIIIAH-like family protein [Ruminococcus flavefaciens]